MANLSQLASDDNNPDFVGARNPDDLLFVRFHEVPLQNNWMTEKEGRPIFDTIIFTEITTPGNQLNIIDRPKHKQDEFRFPRQWAHFQNTHSDDPAKQGTPLSAWPFLDVSKVEMLKAMKFYTVESIAYASDDQINTLGMLAGMAPLSFRQKAKAYLEVAKDSSIVAKREEELKAVQDKLAENEAKHAAEMAEMNAKMTAILERMAVPEPTSLVQARKKYIMTVEHKEKLRLAREAKKKDAHGNDAGVDTASNG
jgi:hypothetical protein